MYGLGVPNIDRVLDHLIIKACFVILVKSLESDVSSFVTY